jgi:hypothetical protein
VRDGTEGTKNFFISATHKFVENKNIDLVNNDISYDQFYKAYNAKNQLYENALLNPAVK